VKDKTDLQQGLRVFDTHTLLAIGI